MPTSEGKIYLQTVGNVTYGISLQDVAVCLSENSNDEQTLCMSQKINMWAKFKPERVGDQRELTIGQRRSNNFGIRPTQVYNSVESFIAAVADGSFTGGWTYDRVRATDRGRIHDFVGFDINRQYIPDSGYNHYAKPPFGGVDPFTGYLSQNNTSRLQVPLNAPEMGEDNTGIDNQITMSDFQQGGMILGDWFLGILLYKNTSQKFISTTSIKIATNNDWQVTFNEWINPVYAGEYKAVPFLSSAAITDPDYYPSEVKIIGVGSAGVKAQLKTANDIVYPRVYCCRVAYSPYLVRYRVSFKNMTSTSQHRTNVVLLFAKYESNTTNSYSVKVYGSIDIDPGEEWSDEGIIDTSSNGGGFNFAKLQFDGGSTNWEPFDDEDVPGSEDVPT